MGGVKLRRYTVSALGHLVDSRNDDSSSLPRSMVEDAGRMLDLRGNNFQAQLPWKGAGQVELRWKSDDFSCALATFVADGDMLSTDVILSGLRLEPDRKAQQDGQAMIQELCDGAGETAAEGILRADKRPAVVCIRWVTSERQEMDLVKDLEMCFAAAFLERGFQTARLVF
jgi:hypothetical protein